MCRQYVKVFRSCSTSSMQSQQIIRLNKKIVHACRYNFDKNYVLSNSESVQCNFFIFDHVMFTQFKICCCVQNSSKSDDFSLRCGDISIFKMAAVCHLGIVLTPYETTHEVCCGPQLPVKFHVNLIHKSEDI